MPRRDEVKSKESEKRPRTDAAPRLLAAKNLSLVTIIRRKLRKWEGFYLIFVSSRGKPCIAMYMNVTKNAPRASESVNLRLRRGTPTLTNRPLFGVRTTHATTRGSYHRESARYI